MDVRHSLLFNSSVYDGVPPYNYQWYLDSTPLSGANSSSWNFTSGSAGVYTLYLKATDSVGVPTTSNTVNVTVVPGLVHNVTVTNVTTPNTGYLPMTTAAQGIVPVYIDNLNITVTAADLGTSAETFSVTVYANSTPLKQQGNHSGKQFTHRCHFRLEHFRLCIWQLQYKRLRRACSR
jgi:hypothetical protein